MTVPDCVSRVLPFFLTHTAHLHKVGGGKKISGNARCCSYRVSPLGLCGGGLIERIPPTLLLEEDLFWVSLFSHTKTVETPCACRTSWRTCSAAGRRKGTVTTIPVSRSSSNFCPSIWCFLLCHFVEEIRSSFFSHTRVHARTHARTHTEREKIPFCTLFDMFCSTHNIQRPFVARNVLR